MKHTVRNEAIDVEAVEVQSVDTARVESLTALASEAEAMEAGAGGDGAGLPPGAQAAAPPMDPENAPGVADLVNVLQFTRDAAEPMLVDLGVFTEGQVAAIWSDAALKGIAVPLVQIADRHGVGLGEALDRFGPYVSLVVGLGLPALATVKVVKANRAAATADAGT